MKIAFVASQMENTGGHAIIRKHIEFLREAGYYVELFTAIGKEGTRCSPDDYYSTHRGSPLNKTLSKFDKIILNGYYSLSMVEGLKHKEMYYFHQTDEKDIFPHMEKYAQSFFKEISHFSYSTWLLDKVIGDTKGSLYHIPQGIDYNHIRQYRTEEKEDKVIFMVGYYRPIKGIELAQEVFALLKKKGIKTVLVTPREDIFGADEYYCDPDEDTKLKILNSCKVMLHTSVTETFSLTCAEAMSLGVPVVGTDSKGITLYCDDDNSILTKERNAQLITDNIVKCLEEHEHYSQNAILVAEAIDYSNVKKKIVEFYEQ